jgi:predicted RecA/RadA family phage recombinase
MTTKVVQDGGTYEYTNAGSAISSGDPVKVGTVSAFLGIAATDIAASTGVGTLIIEGVVTLPKVSAAVFAAGDQVLWDVSPTPNAVDDNSASPATGDFWCGTAMVAGANGETTATIKLNGRGTTVT